MSKKWSGEINAALVLAIAAEVNFSSAEYGRITDRVNAQGYGPFTVSAVT